MLVFANIGINYEMLSKIKDVFYLLFLEERENELNTNKIVPTFDGWDC
jgi:hypothetical protein